jgi:predicted DNA-binding transcriptional regulator AlpA
MNAMYLINFLNFIIMSKIIVMEEQKLNTLLKKVEQIHTALIGKPSNTLNEINGFVSESDACKLVGKSKTWLWRKRSEDVLPYKKLGAKIFYAKSDLFNLLKEAV